MQMCQHWMLGTAHRAWYTSNCQSMHEPIPPHHHARLPWKPQFHPAALLRLTTATYALARRRYSARTLAGGQSSPDELELELDGDDDEEDEDQMGLELDDDELELEDAPPAELLDDSSSPPPPPDEDDDEDELEDGDELDELLELDTSWCQHRACPTWGWSGSTTVPHAMSCPLSWHEGAWGLWAPNPQTGNSW